MNHTNINNITTATNALIEKYMSYEHMKGEKSERSGKTTLRNYLCQFVLL